MAVGSKTSEQEEYEAKVRATDIEGEKQEAARKKIEFYIIWVECDNCESRKYFRILKGQRWFEASQAEKCPVCGVEGPRWINGRLSSNEAYEKQEREYTENA